MATRCRALSAPPTSVDQSATNPCAENSLETAGHGERLLRAVFAFLDANNQHLYFIHNYTADRGELERWFPLWGSPSELIATN
jgi:hypothetical protein